ncbi:MAG TPA: hypothetical protein VE053_00535 [Allosphingosinicella sp.]|nr:hypothetical protein [Allosphingosinicella sp.]
MSGPSSRRRLRLRRKRKDETFGSRLSDVGEVQDSSRSARALDFNVGDAGPAVEVVGHMGCCVVEAIGSMAALVALLTVPAYLLIR